MNYRLLTLGLICASFVGQSLSQQPAAARIKLEQVMTADQIQELGLQKLSDEERVKLEIWLGRFALNVANTVAEKGAPRNPVQGVARNEAAIESSIDGTFEGWTGETIFKLTNGQIWQQSRYAYHYHYAFQPKVVIFKDSSGFKMKVDGVTNTVSVTRIK